MQTLSSKWRRWSLFVASLATAAFLLQGCGGGDDGAQGPAGAAGATGATGPTGSAGADRTVGVVDAQKLTFNDLVDRGVNVEITGATAAAGAKPTVNFKVTMRDSGQGLVGLRVFSLHVAQLKPAASGSASYWQNYIADGLPASAIPAFMTRGATATSAPVAPSADAVDIFNADGTLKAKGYTITDNGDGSYKATFSFNIDANTKVPFDASLTHRIGLGVRSVNVPGNYRIPSGPLGGTLASSTGGVTPTAVTAGAYPGPINPTTGAILAAFTNTNGAVATYDFVPSTGAKLTTAARDNVTIAACNQCHYKLEYGSNNTSGHFGSRPDTKICVMCHTPQNTAGKGDFTPFIHQIHMGEELPAAVTGLPAGFETTVAEIKFPQDQRNCTTCHKGAVTDSWANPSRKACGSCHSNVNFATGANHGLGGIRTDDSACSLCHDKAYIQLWHTPVATYTPKATSTRPASGIVTLYAHNANLPTGAYKIEYVINSVTLDSARKPSVKFGIKKDGALVNFGTYNATTHKNIIDNTVGGPSIRIQYNVSQDGITSPADFNANISAPALGIPAPTVSTSAATPPSTFTPASTTSNIWVNGGTLTSGGITWTLTGPGSDGYYTISSSAPLPASTTMVSALMYGSMTQTNLTDYPYAAASIADYQTWTSTLAGVTPAVTSYGLKKSGLILNPQVALKASTSTGLTARRTVVANAKCNACHEQLGLFTKSVFHGGARNDGTACHICHTPNGNNGGWSYSANVFVHAIHGASKRSVNYTFQAASATDGFFNIGYPGILKNCEQCHLAGTYDLSATASAATVGKTLFNTVATGTTGTAGVTTSPYISQVAGTKYGLGFSYTIEGAPVATYTLVDGTVMPALAAAPAGGYTRPAEATTLVTSPIASACSACHDTETAIMHMKINGASFYEARATALAKKETCLVCHGATSSTNIANDETPALKAVHRWW